MADGDWCERLVRFPCSGSLLVVFPMASNCAVRIKGVVTGLGIEGEKCH